jgi:hypothetical protein
LLCTLCIQALCYVISQYTLCCFCNWRLLLTRHNNNKELLVLLVLVLLAL